MDPKLPQGLVTMSSIPSDKSLQHEPLNPGVYKNLWQVYYISRLASKDETEHRLEHLFWRIWSKPSLATHLDARTLDRLILRIKTPDVLVGQKVTSSVSESNKERPTEQAKTCSSGSSIHSILKKPHATPPVQPAQSTQVPEAESQKSTRLLLDTSIGTKITLDPSKSPISMASPTPIPEARPAPKKGHLTATRNGRGPRRRPVFNRRKSSQTSIPKSPTIVTPRRRSEPVGNPDGAHMYEDSYVELGLLQHLSFREEEDQIARDLGWEIAPEPKPAKPAVPLFDEVDEVDDPLPEQPMADTSAPFPRASSLKHPMLSLENLGRIKQSFVDVKDVKDVDLPGGPQFGIDDVDGEWTDVDAVESTLPITQPLKSLLEHHEQDIDKSRSVIHSDVISSATLPVADGIEGAKF